MSKSQLEHAKRLVEGDLDVRGHSVRAACWIARNALEEEVRRLLLAKRLDPGRASMRSQLSCLEASYRDENPSVVLDAEYAWARLSAAAHHHAFELDPSITEVRHLLNLVSNLWGGAE